MSDFDDAREALALANRILVQQGVLDAFGHVSMRDPADPSRFLLSRSLAPALVAAGDVRRFDLQSRALDTDGAPAYLERFIHGAVYAARTDVQAVVHSHAASVLPFAVVKSARLRPVCHMGGFLGAGIPNFEIRERGGLETDLLVRDNTLGASMAERLGDASVVLMRGHGMTVVGASLAQAVFRAVYTAKNAAIQSAAMALGDVDYLNEAEARNADLANQSQVMRAWNIWARQARSETPLPEAALP